MENQESPKLTAENYLEKYLRFRDRQAGISVVYCPDTERYTYNVYCIETKILKELLSVEFSFLDDALVFIHQEFNTWEICDYEEKKSGCDSCQANH